MKKPKRTTLNNQLDKLFSEIIRSRGKCERCNRVDDTLQTSHVFSRSHLSVRWDFDNAFCFCASCHWWWHKNPPYTKDCSIKILGEDVYDELVKRKEQICKRSIENLIEMRDSFKEMVK